MCLYKVILYSVPYSQNGNCISSFDVCLSFFLLCTDNISLSNLLWFCNSSLADIFHPCLYEHFSPDSFTQVLYASIIASLWYKWDNSFTIPRICIYFKAPEQKSFGEPVSCSLSPAFSRTGKTSLCRGKLNCLIPGRSKPTARCQTGGSAVGPPAQWFCRLIPCSAFSLSSQNLKSSKCCCSQKCCLSLCRILVLSHPSTAEFSSFLMSLLVVHRKHILRGECGLFP